MRDEHYKIANIYDATKSLNYHIKFNSDIICITDYRAVSYQSYPNNQMIR
jgi:hypothetical protein